MNFSDNNGYSKQEVNEFVDYVIKKTEENILTIKRQKDEIEYLKKENERLKTESNPYVYMQNKMESIASEIKSNAKYEAELIIEQAKDNASRIVNDALLKSEKLERERKILDQNMKIYKRKVKNAMREHLDSIDDIEIL